MSFRQRLPLVEAYLSGDEGQVLAVTERTPHNPQVAALWAAHESFWGRLSYSEAYSKMRATLEPPPEDRELFWLLLERTAMLTIQMNKMAEARSSVQLLEQLTRRKASKEWRARALRVESRLAAALGNESHASDLLNKALKLKLRAGSGTWYELKATRAARATLDGDLPTAERDLADLERYGAVRPVLPLSLGYIKALYFQNAGRIEEALAVLGSDPQGVPPLPMLVLRAEILTLAGRTEEAQDLLRSLLQDKASPLEGSLYEQGLGFIALTRHDWEGARRHARSSITHAGHIHPNIIQRNLETLVLADLASRHAASARVLLRMLDPDENRRALLLHWSRLYLLEGDETRAASCFKRTLQSWPLEAIQRHLRFAPELAAHQVAGLWHRAESLREVPCSDETSLPQSPGLIGETPLMKKLKADIDAFAPSPDTLLITGETGTGKEVVARLLHEKSPRSSHPFIAVNCAAISDTLIEAELFGYAQGAFTGAMDDHEGLFIQAGPGTIFLDEIDSMSSRLQAALLRVLEVREVRPLGGTETRRIQARIVAASKKPLERAVREKAFREDLYFRLARLTVSLPPLRERGEDIPLLARYFLDEVYGNGHGVLEENLMDALRRRPWPGNVRELRNEIRRLAIMAGENRILSAELLDVTYVPAGPEAASPALKIRASTRRRRRRLEELFREHGKLTPTETTRLMGNDYNTIVRDLESLESEGVIHRVRAVKRTSYFALRKDDRGRIVRNG